MCFEIFLIDKQLRIILHLNKKKNQVFLHKNTKNNYSKMKVENSQKLLYNNG